MSELDKTVELQLIREVESVRETLDRAVEILARVASVLNRHDEEIQSLLAEVFSRSK